MLLQPAFKDDGFVAEGIHAADLHSGESVNHTPIEGQKEYLEIRCGQVSMVRRRRKDVKQATRSIRLVDLHKLLHLRQPQYRCVLVLLIADDFALVLFWDRAVVHDRGDDEAQSGNGRREVLVAREKAEDRADVAACGGAADDEALLWIRA